MAVEQLHTTWGFLPRPKAGLAEEYVLIVPFAYLLQFGQNE
jgi:hypothetical protein